MKDRLVTLLCAVAALGLFYGLFIGDRTGGKDVVSRPVGAEPGANGYLGIERWLESERVTVVSLRRRYDSLLDDPAVAPRGNVMITTLPHKRNARWREVERLKEWVRAGNTVVVAAALFDTPEWGFLGTPPYLRLLDVLDTLSELTEISFDVCPKDEDAAASSASATDATATPAQKAPDSLARRQAFLRRLDAPKRGFMVPNASHPLNDGVRVVVGVSEYPADVFCAPSPDDAGMLTLMHDGVTPTAWLRRMEEGTVIVSGYGSIFTNKVLGQEDNARWLANILRAQLASDGVVYLDDLHQGISSVYDADAFYGDPRLHTTFWWIIGLWLVYVVGSTRLRSAPPAQSAIDESELTVAIGHLLARTLRDRRAGERMFEHFFNEVRRRLGWPEDGKAIWDWLRTTTRIEPERIARLERLHAALERDQRVDLVDLHNSLCALRRELS